MVVLKGEGRARPRAQLGRGCHAKRAGGPINNFVNEHHITRDGL